MNISRQRWWVLLLIWFWVGSIFSSCNSSVQESKTHEKTVAAVAETPKEAPIKEYPLERYGDPEIFSTPRLQFSWKAPGDKEKSLWSIKLDGSDLRRVLSYDLLYKEGLLYNYMPLRSPNNRYIYIAQDHSGDWPRRNLIDLKNQTVSILVSGGIVPLGTWSMDSKNLYFYCDVNFFNYNTGNKKLIKQKWIPSQGIHVLPNGKFFALHETGFSIHSLNGDKEEFVALGKNILPYYALSKDGDLLMYHDSGDDSHVVSLNEPLKKIYSDKIFKSSAAFGIKNTTLYYIHKGFEIRKIYLRENRWEIIFNLSFGKYGMRHITLIDKK